MLGDQGAPAFERFTQQSYRAYTILRNQSGLLMTLFSLMLSCGIPELQRESDILYLKDKLRLQDTEQQAAEYFSSKIRECLGNRMTRLNDAVHLYAHSG